jgi:hypothetical protein
MISETTLQEGRIIDNLETESLPVSMKADFYVMKVLASENILPLLGGMKDDMPLVMAKLFDQITPFSENRLVKDAPSLMPMTSASQRSTIGSGTESNDISLPIQILIISQ